MWRRAGWLLGPLGLCLIAVVALPSVATAADGTTAVADGPTAVAVHGPGLAEGLIVRVTERPDRFEALLSEVDWLATRPGNAPNPDPASLGPKYQLVVLIDEVPDQTYDIYPLARGGPRVFRPAEQPKRTVAAAWFYGRVSMPDTLRDAGVPLAAPTSDPSGGEGGGEAVPGQTGVGQNQAGTGQNQVTGQNQAGGQNGAGTGQRRAGQTRGGAAGTPAPGPNLDQIVRRWQRDLLIIGGGAILLLLMLGFVSRLTRRG